MIGLTALGRQRHSQVLISLQAHNGLGQGARVRRPHQQGIVLLAQQFPVGLSVALPLSAGP